MDPFSDFYSGWPYIGRHVCAEPMKMRHLDLYCLRGTLDLIVKTRLKGLKCNYTTKNGTKLQLKNLDCFKNKKLKTKIGLKLDSFAIKQKKDSFAKSKIKLVKR